MHSFQTLLSFQKPLPKVGTIREVQGFFVWIVWDANPDATLGQSLEEYGGVCLLKDGDQSLWFFFNTDALLALARLQLWAKLNTVPLTAVLFTGKVEFGIGDSFFVVFPEVLSSQVLPKAEEFTVWVHPEIQVLGRSIPGLQFVKAQPPQGLIPVNWFQLFADSRISYSSNLGWYCILRPLGNPLEKSFQMGWRGFFGELENILRRLKLRYTIHDNFLLFPLENLRILRLWVKDFSALVAKIKKDTPALYWPTVQVVIDKKGLNFSTELPKKVNLDWDQLLPDFPHMSFKNSCYLGDEFVSHDVRFKVATSSVEDWCNISLKTEDNSSSSGVLPVNIAVPLVVGHKGHCFYCGLRSHESVNCPSKQILDWEPGVWKKIATLDFSAFNRGFLELTDLMGNNGEQVLREIFQSGTGSDADSLGVVLARAVFDINSPVQHHMMQRLWLSRSKDCPKGFVDIGTPDENPVWRLSDAMSGTDLIPLEKEAITISQRYPRDQRPRTANGFIALERGDFVRASALWKEAEMLSTNILQKAYHQFLQARLIEIQGKYELARSLYDNIISICSEWIEPRYRQAVCQVKMGFAEQAVDNLILLAKRQPDIMNRVLIDPELERGRILLLSALYSHWGEIKALSEENLKSLDRVKFELEIWFPSPHEYYAKTSKRLDDLEALAGIENYVPFQTIIKTRVAIDKDILNQVSVEAKQLRNKFKAYMMRLQLIYEEASWFPFPKLLVEFNKSFRIASANLEWALKSSLLAAETFKKAQKVAEKEGERIKKLEEKLKFLKIVRDCTLFILIMGRTFFWLEIIVLFVVMVGLPLLIYYGDKSGFLGSNLVFAQKWQIQAGIIFIASLFALGLAALRAALVFEKKRVELLQKSNPTFVAKKVPKSK